MSIFKANDIRGLYPQDWDKETAEGIGYFLPDIMPGQHIVIGRDGRESSVEILHYLSKGLNNRGVNVIDIGVVDTPAVYFAVGHFGYDGAVMITASHNPVGYNGLKFTGKNAVPINFENGLDVLESKLKSIDKYQIKKHGEVLKKDITHVYINYLNGFKPKSSKLKAVYDCSNGSIANAIHYVLADSKKNVILINDSVKGDFPNHGPNPTLAENLLQLKEKIKKERADIGFCFDGDGDRVVVVNSKGEVVSPDLITALLGLYYFRLQPEDRQGDMKVLVDIRSSKAVIEFLEELGAEVISCPVGHSKIKKQMRSVDAVFAGELTGHYYFRENYYSDSAWISVFRILSVLSEIDITLDDLQSRMSVYSHSGELNFSVTDSRKAIETIIEEYSDAVITNLDGYRFDYPDWWFIVRESGTEPLLRLVVEAANRVKLEEKVDKIKKIILKYTP
ncbi:MAG: hypothetical protein DRP60_15565 [Spirochaetes bacterium]|nr:MAG: hypothetical protein DRP60_15565 [Spirochaetota bacterium]